MKTVTPTWSAADFECMNKPVDDQVDSNKKLFASQPVAIGFNVVKNSCYDNLNIATNGYYIFFGED